MSKIDNQRGFNKVFGIGIGKTGTTSLTEALKILGLSSIHYPRQLSEIDDYDSATDSLVVVNYKLLDKKYPNSKFILTVRDEESWLRSFKNHFDKIPVPPKETVVYKLRQQALGTTEYNQKKLAARYKEHLKDVYEYFIDRPDDLLVMNISSGDGFEKLCSFLGVDKPEESFPRENVKSEESLKDLKGKTA